MANVRMIKFDPEKMRKWLDDRKLTATEVSLASGRGPGYMAVAVHRGCMSQAQAVAMNALYGFKLADVMPTPKRAVEPEPVVETKPVAESKPQNDDWQSEYDGLEWNDYQLRVKVLPDRLCVTVLRNGAVCVHAWSNRKSLSEVDTLQAISYAAHMCYKFVQQKELANGR